MNTGLGAADPWWDYSRACAAALRRGEPAPSVRVYGPMLDDGEQTRLCTTATSSRLVAGDGSYQRSSTFVLGSPCLTLGVLAAQGLINGRRRRQARRDEVAQWRDHQQSTIVVTDERIMCSGPEGTLVDFWFGYTSEFYPDLQARTVTFAYEHRCLPLRLAGPPAVAIALWSAHALYGPAWISDVRLQPLLSGPESAPALTPAAVGQECMVHQA